MAQFGLIISPDGKKTTRVDLLEDYWTDFSFFRRDAWASERNQDRLRTQRFVRAGLFAFISYLNGLANRWSSSDSSLLPPGSKLSSRLAELADRFQVVLPPIEELEFLGNLFSKSFELQSSDQVDLFLALSIDRVDSAECKIVAWLDEFVRETNLPGLAKIRDAGRSYAALMAANGGVFEENDNDVDLPDEGPNPFQDRAEDWENAPSKQSAGREPE
jgi:hypothetical protein